MTPELTVDPIVVREMRARFREGCSVADLVGVVRNRFPDREVSLRELTGYFREAFRLSPSGMYVLGYVESFGNGQSPDAKLNWLFIPEILANRAEWDNAAESAEAWYNGLESTSILELHRFAEQHRCELSEQSWGALTPSERDVLRALEATRLKLSEDVQNLAALVECLQRRIRETEAHAVPMETPAV